VTPFWIFLWLEKLTVKNPSTRHTRYEYRVLTEYYAVYLYLSLILTINIPIKSTYIRIIPPMLHAIWWSSHAHSSAHTGQRQSYVCVQCTVCGYVVTVRFCEWWCCVAVVLCWCDRIEGRGGQERLGRTHTDDAGVYMDTASHDTTDEEEDLTSSRVCASGGGVWLPPTLGSLPPPSPRLDHARRPTFATTPLPTGITR